MGLRDLLNKKKIIIEEMRPAAAVIEEYSNKLAAVEAEIETVIAEPAVQIRTATGRKTGTIDLVIDDIKVKHCLPKKVVWDQSKMQGIRRRIIDGGDDPDKYMDSKTTYTVTEKAYAAFPDPVKAVFEEAREEKNRKTENNR